MTDPRWEIEILVVDKEPMHVVTLYNSKSREVIKEFELPTKQVRDLLEAIENEDSMLPKQVETVLYELKDEMKKDKKPRSSELSEEERQKEVTRNYANAMLDSGYDFAKIHDPELARRNVETVAETGEFTRRQKENFLSSLVPHYESWCRLNDIEPAELPEHLHQYVPKYRKR